MDERTQRISLRAYELWEKRGRQDGSHHEDWLEAEREIDAEMARETVHEAAQKTAPETSPKIVPEVAPQPRVRAARAK